MCEGACSGAACLLRRALETQRVRLVALRWHASGSEVRLGLPVGLQKKKTQRFAVHADVCAGNCGENKNVLIVTVFLPTALDLALRSNMQRRVEILRVCQAPILQGVAATPITVMGNAEVEDQVP